MPPADTTPSSDRPATRLATRISFLVAGFGLACWAPLVPFAKQRLAVDDGTLGLLLLCIGIGSVVAMLLTGPLSARFGSKPIILAGGFGLAVVLPALTLATTPLALATALLAFGAALGSIDVAMNVHAVEVERAAGTPLMSGFHALFSIGGFAGATLMTALLSWGIDPLAGTLASAAAMAIAMAFAWPRLLAGAQGAVEGSLFVRPRGIVLLLAGLAAATFLAEGAMLDWSALLVTDAGLTSASQSGVGYMLFAIAMTVGRLVGDRVTARVGDRNTLLWGGILAVVGFVVLLAAPIAWLRMSGFLLIGLGASNIVPVFFRKAGAQTAMPSALAIGAITTAGYAGILVGPAGIGFVANAIGLHAAFWMVAALLCLIPLTAHIVAGRGARPRAAP
ncbi:MFS transporter [Variovorax boronicumulans]|uniref:MFS transporter n=1 Tax=Variovorax boronicumulans TaxID=436515 RepID=UPI001C55AD52